MKLHLAIVGILTFLSVPSASSQPTVVFLSKWQVTGGLGGIFDGPFDVALAPDGTSLVSDLVKVRRFSAEDVQLEEWFLPPVGINAHGTPSLMAIDDQGNAYISAGLGYVQKLTLSGSLITQWHVQGNAYGIAVGSDGNVFVSGDYSIKKYTPNGQFLMQWGGQGSGPGQFFGVSGIAADRTGRIYALDSGTNHRVQAFDLNGLFLFEWGSQGSGDGQFEVLTDIAVGASGNIYISDEFLKRVQEFRPDGSFVGIVGSVGTGDGQFELPAGMGADGHGNVFVADIMGSAVNRFGPAPTPVISTTWGSIKASYR